MSTPPPQKPIPTRQARLPPIQSGAFYDSACLAPQLFGYLNLCTFSFTSSLGMAARRRSTPKYAAAVLTLTRSKQAMKYIAQGSNKPGLVAHRTVRVSFAESIVFQSAINSTNPLISDAFKYNRRTPYRSGDSG